MDPIGRRGIDTSISAKRALVLLTCAFLILVVSACSSGGVEESRQFQAQDAEEEQQLAQAQQTHIAEQFDDSDATPEPTRTPNAGLSELVLASRIGSGGQPADAIQSVPAFQTTTVYVAASISDLQNGQVVSALWRDKNGNVFASSEVSVSASSSPQWISFPLQLDGSLPADIYSVAILVNGEMLESLVFQIR